eukprot:GHVR01003951.1.p2 GENE.GHVR01003951.1~~GHVR01003951.1.p2  ORF type:complete len:151 (-),score=16.13 GHVR01003951.1:246-698(-)
MFWAVTGPDNNPPRIFANFAPFAIGEAVIGVRQFFDSFAEPAKAFLIQINLRRGEARFAVKGDAFLRRGMARIRDQQTAQHIFAACHQQRCPKLAANPSRQSGMIRMEMGANHAVDRTSAHQLFEMPFPLALGLCHRDAGINHHPAITVA